MPILTFLVPDSQRRPLDDLLDRLDLDMGDVKSKRSAFWIMLVLSALIAISGVIGNSTATVIGAMIVAPLSVPILGVGLGVVTARAGLIGRNLLLLAAGVVVVVVLGYLLAKVVPSQASVLSNSQVTSRTSPTIDDLIAAIATGLVAAIALARRDVGDVLPGVAIAISLVPPLGVVGVCLGSHAPSLALGAFVLFSSNVVAMILTAVVVLSIVGYGAGDSERGGIRRRHLVVLAGALILVSVPMAINSMTSLWSAQIGDATRAWLAGDDAASGAEVLDVTLTGQTATVTVLGPSRLPPLSQLQESVDDLVPWPVDVVVVRSVGGRVAAR